jgi:hypothetical protein
VSSEAVDFQMLRKEILSEQPMLRAGLCLGEVANVTLDDVIIRTEAYPLSLAAQTRRATFWSVASSSIVAGKPCLIAVRSAHLAASLRHFTRRSTSTTRTPLTDLGRDAYAPHCVRIPGFALKPGRWSKATFQGRASMGCRPSPSRGPTIDDGSSEKGSVLYR